MDTWSVLRGRRGHLAIALIAAILAGGCGSPNPAGPSETLALSCTLTNLAPGQQSRCAALLTAQGSTQDQTASAQWTSSNPAVATVSAAGLVTALTSGSVNVTARVQGVSATRSFTVAAGPPTLTLRVQIGTEPGTSVAVQDVMDVDFIPFTTGNGVPHSGGNGLLYSLSYGDGIVDTTPNRGCCPASYFGHKYRASGTFNAQMTVTDDQGRQASANAAVTVQNLTATWRNVIQNPPSGPTETRMLSLVQGAGGSLTGSYTHPAGNAEPMSGSVDETGSVKLVLSSRTITLSGNTLDANGVTPDASALKLILTGGSADGLTLVFARQ